MTRINLLPWRSIERARKQREFLAMLGASAVACAMVVLYSHLHINGMITSQEARNSYLQQEITLVDARIKAIKDLEHTKSRLLARMEIIQELQGSRPQIVHLFDEIAGTVPDGVYLSKLSRQGKQLTIFGQAQSNARVSAYMRSLDQSEWLTNPKLSVIKNLKTARTRSSEFSLRVSQTNKTERWIEVTP
ncbi:MAG TPA: pilus assembly protein PilN [Chromatiaceae bacterium]|jgi:type IV pilus assembly protein PilN|nr:pilus assembly protein PilN [Chromatiaceae bacterium]HIA08999.1 pilus assembly protein PilN [Chromatiaceae bacterium]HIN82908.1 pilus assembly protein PilN [Chromatiales bacterium]HIO15088.1 pilus assembly protein PilN [Chromatiales bacterium]HIO54654.1 pilus assembly protein PilN [Chromatiales bacterium]